MIAAQLQAATDALEEVKRNEGLEKPSSHVSKSTSEVNSCDNSSVLLGVEPNYLVYFVSQHWTLVP